MYQFTSRVLPELQRVFEVVKRGREWLNVLPAAFAATPGATTVPLLASDPQCGVRAPAQRCGVPPLRRAGRVPGERRGFHHFTS